jgi:8-oxo-dGTP diphosphatase
MVRAIAGGEVIGPAVALALIDENMEPGTLLLLGSKTMTSQPAIPQFGIQERGCEYTMRPGAYVLMRNEEGLLAIVRAPSGTYLPGGGQDPGETLEETAAREVTEECGIRAEIGAFVGVADEFVHEKTRATHFQKRASFFLAKAIGSANKTELDHVLRWVTDAEALKILSYGCQRWAVEIGRELKFEP